MSTSRTKRKGRKIGVLIKRLGKKIINLITSWSKKPKKSSTPMLESAIKWTRVYAVVNGQTRKILEVRGTVDIIDQLAALHIYGSMRITPISNESFAIETDQGTLLVTEVSLLKK